MGLGVQRPQPGWALPFGARADASSGCNAVPADRHLSTSSVWLPTCPAELLMPTPMSQSRAGHDCPGARGERGPEVSLQIIGGSPEQEGKVLGRGAATAWRVFLQRMQKAGKPEEEVLSFSFLDRDGKKTKQKPRDLLGVKATFSEGPLVQGAEATARMDFVHAQRCATPPPPRIWRNESWVSTGRTQPKKPSRRKTSGAL